MELKNSIKADLCQELRRLTEEFNLLSVTPSATQRDYVRVGNKIKELCAVLDGMDGNVR